MKINKNTTLKTFLLGDFDGDGVLNVDDPYPFNKNRTYPPKNYRKSKHYQKARFYDPDVKLSTQLITVQKNNDSYIPFLNKFLSQNRKSYGRIKSVPSTLNKLIHKKNYLSQVHDVAAVTVPTNKRKEVYPLAKRIKRNYKYDKDETDDYYKKPKDGVYYGYHIGLINNKGKRIEVQVKSNKMIDYSTKMHEDYKKKKSLKKYKSIGKRLYKQGY